MQNADGSIMRLPVKLCVLVDTKSMKITAKYTSEGALTDIKIEKANISEITAPINTATEKIFYWESFESMKPIELK